MRGLVVGFNVSSSKNQARLLAQLDGGWINCLARYLQLVITFRYTNKRQPSQPEGLPWFHP
jgi:hypothetical protein